VLELRVDYGPGYRIYATRRGQAVFVLLAGGDKRTQAADIAKARKLARDLRQEDT